MASKGLQKEQVYTTKLLILVSFIALVTIAAANNKLLMGNITGAYSSAKGDLALGLLLAAGLSFMFIYMRDKAKRK